MYIIDITIDINKVPAEKADALLAAHRAWFKEQFDKGHFLLVGPYQDRQMSGVIVAQASSRAELDEILKKDVYYDKQMASYNVSEFKANFISEKIVDFKRK